jgi:hypothetical protein
MGAQQGEEEEVQQVEVLCHSLQQQGFTLIARQGGVIVTHCSGSGVFAEQTMYARADSKA